MQYPALCRWYILTHLDGSLSNVVLFTKIAGVQGVRSVWPWPSPEAWAILSVFGALQAFLQLAVPGKQHAGPVSPKGNVPIYKVHCAHPLYCILWHRHSRMHTILRATLGCWIFAAFLLP